MKQHEIVDLSDDELVDVATACQIIGGTRAPIHRTSLWRGVRDGRYPKPIKIGRVANRWVVGELRQALRALAMSRHGGEAG